MLVVDCDGRLRRFFQPEITIGSAADSHLVLTSPDVATLVLRWDVNTGKCEVSRIGGIPAIFVGDLEIGGNTATIWPGDVVRIGPHILTFAIEDDEDTAPVDATELRLLAGLAQRDDASREVYADWLETQGFCERAEFLRLQEALLDAPTDIRDLILRMRELAIGIELGWRHKVARPLIDNCPSFGFNCPRDWGSLGLTDVPTARTCAECGERVLYCDTMEEARARVWRDRVVVDILAMRADDYIFRNDEVTGPDLIPIEDDDEGGTTFFDPES